MPARIEIAPERLAEGRDLYEHTLTSVEEIAARMKISQSTLYARIRRDSGSAATDKAPVAATAVPVQAPVVDYSACRSEPDQSPAGEVTVEKRAALYARAFRAAERQMDSIEAAMQQLRATPAPFERTARALVMLNRSLRDVLALTKADETALSNETDDNAIPRDMDAFPRRTGTPH